MPAIAHPPCRRSSTARGAYGVAATDSHRVAGRTRRIDDKIDLIYVSLLPRYGKALASFTFHVGFLSFGKFFRGCTAYGFECLRPRTPSLIATDLGRMSPPFKHKEWELHSEGVEIALPPDLCREIEGPGLSFFKRYASVDAVLSAWEAGEHFNGDTPFLIAGTCWYLGKLARARDFIQRQIDELREEARSRGDIGDPALGWRRFLEYLEKKGPRRE